MRPPRWFLLALMLARPAIALPVLRLSPETRCVFAGQEMERTLEFGERVSGSLVWSADVLPTHRPLARREVVLERLKETTLRIPVPPLRDGLEMTIELHGTLRPEDGLPLEFRNQFQAMAVNAFAEPERQRLARSLHILESDERLAACLAENGIQARTVRGPGQLSADQRGILLLGPDTRLDREDFGGDLARLAEGGWRVVVIEPAPGFLPLPPAERVALATETVVADLGKWLHPRFGSRKWGLALAAKQGGAGLETSRDSLPFCWAEFAYASGGTMVCTTLPILSAWNEEPTPRYLLRAILADRQAPAAPAPDSSSHPSETNQE
ncbi:MAG: hypothetical protein RBU25_04145 [Lentisphaeria bacterium]|nr:hypothetical protein [Lentisphaeria bacterium]